MPSRALVHSESDIKAGVLSVNDAYDIKMFKLPTGDFEIVVFMKLQFYFENSSSYKWKGAEKSLFVKSWEFEVKKTWGNKILKVLGSGKKVYLIFEFDSQVGGWMFDHWELTVTKIKPGTFRTSYVKVERGRVSLDSEDLTPINSSWGDRPRTQHFLGES